MRRQFIRLRAGVVDQDLEYDGQGAQDAPVPVGLIEVTGHVQWQGIGSLLGMVYDGTTFTAGPVAPVRIISVDAFLDRLTMDEHTALETLRADSARARAWWGQLVARRMVDLDSERLVTGLAWLKANGVPALWPDAATADARIASIRA